MLMVGSVHTVIILPAVVAADSHPKTVSFVRQVLGLALSLSHFFCNAAAVFHDVS